MSDTNMRKIQLIFNIAECFDNIRTETTLIETNKMEKTYKLSRELRYHNDSMELAEEKIKSDNKYRNISHFSHLMMNDKGCKRLILRRKRKGEVCGVGTCGYCKFGVLP